MRKLLLLIITIVCQIMAIPGYAQNLNGKWKFESVSKDKSGGIDIYINGEYTFDNSGDVIAHYRLITTFTPEEIVKDIKSVYYDLKVDGTGRYDIKDSSLNVVLEKSEDSFKMGEGTLDNMDKELVGKSPEEQKILKQYFGIFNTILVDGIKNIHITDININGDEITGSFMGNTITLTKLI